MIEFGIMLFCLLVSFLISFKKLKIAAMFQVILALIVSVIVLFFLPASPFAYVAKLDLGYNAFYLIQDILMGTNILNIAVADVIIYAIVLLTTLSICEFIYFVKEITTKKRQERIEIIRNNYIVYEHKQDFVTRIYLLYCRLLD